MPFRISPRRWSIRVKSVMLATGYLLALSAVYIAFTVYLLRRETSQAHDRLQQTARIVATEIDAYVASGAQRLQTVMRLPGLAYGLQSIQEAPGNGSIPPWTTLHYLFFKSPVFTGGVFLLDRTGKVLWTEPPGLPWMHQSFTDFAPVAQVLQVPRSMISSLLTGDHLLAQPHVAIVVPDLHAFEAAEIVSEIVRHLGGPTDEAELRRWLAEHFAQFDLALTAVGLERR